MAGLTIEDLRQIATRVVGPDAQVRDRGLLVAALARAEATDGGDAVYPSAGERAAALLHSLATTSPLVQGNRAFALASALTLLALEECPAGLDDAAAVALVTDIVTGRVESVPEIAARLRPG